MLVVRLVLVLFDFCCIVMVVVRLVLPHRMSLKFESFEYLLINVGLRLSLCVIMTVIKLNLPYSATFQGIA